MLLAFEFPMLYHYAADDEEVNATMALRFVFVPATHDPLAIHILDRANKIRQDISYENIEQRAKCIW